MLSGIEKLHKGVGEGTVKCPAAAVDLINHQTGQVRRHNRQRRVGALPCAILGAARAHKRKLGRTIDSPTINQNFPPEHIVPRYGVYACRVIIDGDYYGGVSNVGVRPSVNGQSVNCETHIFDYSGDLYDREIRVEFLHFIRPEVKFSSVEELKNAIDKDKKAAKTLLGIE